MSACSDIADFLRVVDGRVPEFYRVKAKILRGLNPVVKREIFEHRFDAERILHADFSYSCGWGDSLNQMQVLPGPIVIVSLLGAKTDRQTRRGKFPVENHSFSAPLRTSQANAAATLLIACAIMSQSSCVICGGMSIWMMRPRYSSVLGFIAGSYCTGSAFL